MRIQQLDLAAAFASLRSRPEGLTTAEAGERLAEYGPNRLRDVRRTPLRLLRQLTHAFALILWIAAGLAWFAAWRDPAGGMGALAAAIVYGLFGNRLIVAGVTLEVTLLLFIVYTPAGNRVLGAAPLPAAAWAWMLPFAAALLVFEEARKWQARRA